MSKGAGEGEHTHTHTQLTKLLFMGFRADRKHTQPGTEGVGPVDLPLGRISGITAGEKRRKGAAERQDFSKFCRIYFYA